MHQGALASPGRDPDGRVMVLERSEENPQLTWMWTRALRLPPSSTLCGGMPNANDNSTTGQDADRSRPVHLMHRIGENEWKALKLN